MIEQIGRYRVLGQLGKGGMGVVLLAEDPMLNRRVAIKTLDLSLNDPAERDTLRGYLLRDARAAAALLHPHIVAVYDVFEEGESAYLVLEYVAGQSLAQRLAAGPPPDPPFILRVLREMASALDYTHSRGVIHRDIKPANVMLDEQGSAKITDFGIARVNDARTRTLTGTVMGTLDYMAPEQVKGEPLDGGADQFALAAVAYQMLTGHTVYGDCSAPTLTYKIVHEPAPSARTFQPGLPAAVDEVLARSLRKTSAERYPTCAEFAADLDRAFAGDRIASPGNRRRSRAATITAVSAVFAVGAAAALVILLKPAPTPKVQAPAPEIGIAAPLPAPTAAGPATPPIVPRTQPPAARVAEPRKAEPSGPPEAAPPEHQDEAPAQLEPATGSLPPAVRAAYDQGMFQFQAGNYSAAAASFTRAIQLKPDMLPAYTARAQSYLRRDMLDDAIKDLSEVLRRNPRQPLALGLRGVCYMRKQQNDLALADLNLSLEIAPSAQALTTRGAVYLNQKDYQKAIGDLTSAIQLQPDYAPAYRNRRMAELAIGNRPAARADFVKFQQLTGKPGRK